MLRNTLPLFALTAALAAPMAFGFDDPLVTLAPSCAVPSDAPFGTGDSLSRVVTLEADLSSLNENPAITDHAASGTLRLSIRLERTVATAAPPTRAFVTAQFNFTTQQAETVTAAHIHSGAAGTNGDVVLPLNPTTRFDVAANAAGTSSYQAEITDQATLNSILAIVSNPQNYYANVHTVSEPNGIMRGQLHYGSSDDLQCLRSAIGALSTELASIKGDLTGVATGAASVVSTVGSIRTDITALKTSVASIQSDVATIKTQTASGSGGTGTGTGGSTAIDQDLKTAIRLIIQIAYTQGVVGSAERDMLLATYQ